MRMAEEFDRCEECSGGWFRIERRVLIEKGSPVWAPMHHKTSDVYICTQCSNEQYLKPVDEEA